ncbi:hypothetical protein DQW77_16090 [Roseovarius sp. TE539]|nr:hypothetical protein DQW77_16090 [Roseovarius sp. TE539]
MGQRLIAGPLAPFVNDSGAMRGKRAINGRRRPRRHVIFQAALVASHHNPVLKAFAHCLRAAGKPHNVVITAVARKLVTIVNTLCESRQKWSISPSEKYSCSRLFGAGTLWATSCDGYASNFRS